MQQPRSWIKKFFLKPTDEIIDKIIWNNSITDTTYASAGHSKQIW